MRRNVLIIWVLILSILVQGFVPVLASDASPVAGLFSAYQRAHTDYVRAVESQASLDEIGQKLELYLNAQQAYRAATGQDTSPQLPAESLAPAASQQESLSSTPAVSQSDEMAAQALALSPEAAEEAQTVEQAKEEWSLWQRFKSTIVSGTMKMLGMSGDPNEMPMWERIAWTIGKSLLPSMGVVIATALLAPLAPVAMVIGGVVTGAALAGVMTYAFEKRMNARYRTVKKEDAKIWRDVTVQATVEAVMAPFNLATGGLFGMVGPTVGHAIGKVALTQAGITFVGRALSSQVGGAVKNAWAKYYFKYPEKIEATEARIDEILNAHLSSQTPFSEETVKELDRLRSELDMMKSETYSKEDAVKDFKRAGVSALISGFAGSVISDRTYNSTLGRWADKASVKLFGSVAKGKTISSLFSTMPVNFASGMTGASLEKSFINSDINELRGEQKTYAPGTPPWEYYERAVADKELARDSINTTKAGFDSMMNNFAVHAARLSVDAIKYNVYDGPKARKAAVEQIYREKDPEWKKATQLQEKYEAIKGKAPNPLRYRNPANYAKAVVSYRKQLDAARSDWLRQSEVAHRAESQSQNVALKNEIKVSYEREVKLNQMLELGRLSGGQAHLNAMKKVLQMQNPELANVSDDRLSELAALAIKRTYDDKFESSSKRAQDIEALLEKRRQYKDGKLELAPAEVKELTGRAAVISPSQYKAALVEKYVYELKSQNVRWSEVERRMPEILSQAERQMLEQYNNNWVSVLTAEAYANGLAKYKYDPDGGVSFSEEMKKLVAKVPQMVKSNLLGEYTREVNKAITSTIIPSDPSSDLESYLATFGKTAINESTNQVVDSVYNASSEKIRSSFFH
ncbi:MAG: hypothetical protein CVV42_20005 [Candidatus Riflebacteria bacterium HGW-Riflebacteria-2]|jgi:hypothetical protein|nr:MAG: hypothetical protein CVV42_20005 [Candidatus Riflebacteria bacterium HGW-Riflebacteria-2]